MLIFSSFHMPSLFFFLYLGHSSWVKHGQQTEYGEDVCITNNYNDVFFTTIVKFRQMDLAEELLPIW